MNYKFDGGQVYNGLNGNVDGLVPSAAYDAYKPTNPVYNPTFLHEQIYNSYGSILQSVEKVFETAASIVFNTYHKWIDLKGSDPVKYKECLGMMHDMWIKSKNKYNSNDSFKIQHDYHTEDEHKVECFDLFRFLMENASNGFIDIHDLFGRQFYYDSVKELRKELQKNKILDHDYKSSIKLDIENNFEYMSNKFKWSNDDIGIKVRPIISSIEDINPTNTMASVPSINFRVYIDIRTILNLMTEVTARLSEHDSEYLLDKEGFVEFIHTVFNKSYEQLTRHICLECLDCMVNVNNGWDIFLKKINRAIKDIHNSDWYNSLQDKINHVLRISGKGLIEHDSVIPESNSSEDINFLFNDHNHNYIIDVDSDDMSILGDYSSFVENLVCTNNDSMKKFIKHFCTTLFCRTFTTYFETFSSLNIDNFYESDKITKDVGPCCVSKTTYTREFDRDYDFIRLNNAVSADEFMVRDFFKDIINSYNNRKLTHYNNKKFASGEKCCFIFAKLKRKSIIYLLAEFISYMNARMKFVSIKEASHHANNSEIKYDLINTIDKESSDRLSELLICLSKISESSFIRNQDPCNFNNYITNKYRSVEILRCLNNLVFNEMKVIEPVKRYLNDMIVFINAKFNEKESNYKYYFGKRLVLNYDPGDFGIESDFFPTIKYISNIVSNKFVENKFIEAVNYTKYIYDY